MIMDRRNFILGGGALLGTITAFGLPAVVQASTNLTVAPPLTSERDKVRLMLDAIKEAVEEAQRDYMFESNDATLRNWNLRKGFRDWMEYSLEPYKVDQTIYDYKVVCDETNNTPATIDNNELEADIYIQPTPSVQYIRFEIVIGKMPVDMVL